MGRPASRRWWRRDAFADRLARRAPDLDQVIVALEEPPARALAQTPDNRPFKEMAWADSGLSGRRGALRHHHAYRYAVACHLRRRQSGDALFAGRSGDCAALRTLAVGGGDGD